MVDANHLSATEALASVTKALDVLVLTHDRGEIGVTETARELGISRSTAHRILVTLQRTGFVRHDPGQRGYSLGPQLVRMGLDAIAHLGIRRQARRPLEELSEKLQETVCLYMLDGSVVRLLDGVECQQLLRVSVPLGQTLPAHVTAAGKALLALRDPARVRATLPTELAATAAASITEWPLLEVELEEIRARGWAADLEESAHDLHGVAVAIRNRIGEPLAAISVQAPAVRLREQDMPAIATALQETATTIATAE
ncbi:IclR family transcriptional regulator [Streptomyces griseoviridis]|uniref:IclR family transcriptional regulator n=1 Tax=Streptomyces TaxID=1883 RepID=UPI002474A629|nr:IclR family transcriptional regulator [Streptomyces sp. MAA16]MDH6696834.1 IclR family KDG regulon transcriptional repressor [Streptomyces sp. MAA16]